jgi:uncharacterized repeat protein (TIGR03803 family)
MPTRNRNALLAIFTLAALRLPAQQFTTLASFNGTNGAAPGNASLVQGLSGDLLGATIRGGSNSIGTVFGINPFTGGSLQTIANLNAATGSGPFGGVIQGTDGDLYGTAFDGGTAGDGTVFKIDRSGTVTVLYSFSGGADGSSPNAALIEGQDGNFYGTTLIGGGPDGGGTVFQITPQGILTTLHAFTYADGITPLGSLVQGYDGSLYGTTSQDGANGPGTVFKLTRQGVFSVLHSFDYSDGSTPQAALVLARDGNLYGTTSFGGLGSPLVPGGFGVIFRISPQGAYTLFHEFRYTDGANPQGQLLQANDGYLYGTTADGGSKRYGTIFKIALNGALTTLYNFTGAADGANPEAGLLQATDGSLYGSTMNGGSGGQGTLFQLSTGLQPLVATLTRLGKPGGTVEILDSCLPTISSVTFNGTPATFIPHACFILAVVPAGATTGTVQVTTPTATLSADAAFRVIQ